MDCYCFQDKVWLPFMFRQKLIDYNWRYIAPIVTEAIIPLANQKVKSFEKTIIQMNVLLIRHNRKEMGQREKNVMLSILRETAEPCSCALSISDVVRGRYAKNM